MINNHLQNTIKILINTNYFSYYQNTCSFLKFSSHFCNFAKILNFGSTIVLAPKKRIYVGVAAEI